MTGDLTLVEKLVTTNEARIMLLVLDGLGDIPSREHGGQTPLEAARTPNLDELVKEAVCGRMIPVLPGITPGSGPGHLALFGYDPVRLEIGRGIVEAAGLGLELTGDTLAARANFATMDNQGVITDRRAGRIPTEKTAELCRILSTIEQIDGVQVQIAPSLGHRFVVLFKGEELDPRLSDSDPQKEGQKPLPVVPLVSEARKASEIANQFVAEAHRLLRGEQPANSVLLRGFSTTPRLSTLAERFKLRTAAIANYPAYRGMARLVGMDLLPVVQSVKEQFELYLEQYQQYDFFFVHVKGTDSAGEDGDFDRKVATIEEVDQSLPVLLQKMPDVFAVTGDHSSPVPLKAHSWHPVPVMIHSPVCGADDVSRFTEKQCNLGGLGIFPAINLMPLLLANGKKLKKFGA